MSDFGRRGSGAKFGAALGASGWVSSSKRTPLVVTPVKWKRPSTSRGCRSCLVRQVARPDGANQQMNLAIRRSKRLAFHRFQRYLLGEQDIADDQVAFWHEAPLNDGFAAGVEFLDVHGRAVPDAVARPGVGAHDLEMPMRIPQLLPARG